MQKYFGFLKNSLIDYFMSSSQLRRRNGTGSHVLAVTFLISHQFRFGAGPEESGVLKIRSSLWVLWTHVWGLHEKSGLWSCDVQQQGKRCWGKGAGKCFFLGGRLNDSEHCKSALQGIERVEREE